MDEKLWDVEHITDFHSCARPHGMKTYVLEDLTQIQQTRLNIRKRRQVKNDNKYLADHPEIRGIIAMILRILMKKKPKYDIYETVGHYFTKPSVDIKEEVYAYLAERKNLLGKNSLLQATKDIDSKTSFSDYDKDEYEEFLKEYIEDEIMEEECLQEEEFSTQQLGENESAIRVCQDVLRDVLENVFEEVDTVSLGSIASVGFPVEYEDHAITSLSVLSIDDEDQDQDQDDN